MTMRDKYLSALIIAILALTSCDNDEDIYSPATGNEVNEWIEDMMRNNYLWYQEIPKSESLNHNSDTPEFFYSLLSDKDGKWNDDKHQYFSYIEKHTPTKSSIDANDSYGFDFAISTLKDGSHSHKIALVTYVIGGSPAHKAGLRRGDWIIGINGSIGSIKDYNDLKQGGAATLQLGKIERKGDMMVMTLYKSINIGASSNIKETPFLKDSIYNIGNRKIGYLMYNFFSAGSDEYDIDDREFDNYMIDLFSRFKGSGVNEFVLDLRYNGGGLVTSAQLLSSLLVKNEALGSVFCNMKYNDKNSKNNHTMDLLKTTEVLKGNIDLDRLYVLTGSTTASASELVINSLRPYMEVKTIGKQTIGKTVGMSVYDKSEEYGWIVSPVTFRIYNSNNEADYEDGIVPNIHIDEFSSNLVEFGELDDPLLGEAIYQITGERPNLRSTINSPSEMDIEYNPHQKIGGNLIIESSI